MSILDYVIAKKVVKAAPEGKQINIEIPQNVTEQDVDSIEVPKETREKDPDFKLDKKRPHTFVKEELIPENIKAIPELDAQLEPVVASLLKNWQIKEDMEAQFTQIRNEAEARIEALKQSGNYTDALKTIEANVADLSKAASAINTQSDVVMQRWKTFFIALAKKVKETPDITVSEADKLTFVLNQIKEADSNLSRSIKLKLNYMVKKATVLKEVITKHLRMWPIPEDKQKTGIKLAQTVEESPEEISFELSSATNSYLSDLYTVEQKLNDATKSLMGHEVPKVIK